MLTAGGECLPGSNAVRPTAIYGDNQEDVMKKTVSTALVLVLCLGAAGFGVPKTQIWYSAEELDGGRWQYNYEVANISLTTPIEEFTIWFGYGLYDNLSVETPPVLPPGGWDEIVIQPEPVLEDDGAYDAKALTGGIEAGWTDGPFVVAFDWLGDSIMPGSQFYEIIDPVTLETIDSGWTVPEPGTILLFGLGGMIFSRIYRRERKDRRELATNEHESAEI
jgi:hypothetical protein